LTNFSKFYYIFHFTTHLDFVEITEPLAGAASVADSSVAADEEALMASPSAAEVRKKDKERSERIHLSLLKMGVF
jgi:hypothetical protein